MAAAEGDKGNWSAGFQRLRAEVVLVAVLLFATAFLNLNYSKVPLLGVELVTAVPRGLIALFLLVLFWFLAVNWWLKYLLERTDQLLPPEHVDRLTQALGAAVHPVGRDFTPDISLIRSATTSLKSAADSLAPLVENVMRPMLSELREAKIIRDEKLLKDFPLPDEGRPMSQETLLQIRQHENEAIGSPFSSLTYHADQISQGARRMEAVYHILEEPIARLKEASERHGPNLAEIKKEAAAIRKALKVGLKSFEKRWFGFYFPFGASLVVAGVAHPQTLYDVFKLFDDGNCGPWWTQCIFRAEAPNGPISEFLNSLREAARKL